MSEIARVSAIALGVAALGILATGCSNQSTNPSTATGKTPIRIWRVDQPEDVIRSEITDFTKQYSQFTVSYDNRTINRYELDALKSMAAEQGPDIWSVPNDWIGDHLSVFEPVPENFFYPKDKNGKRQSTGQSPVEAVRALYPAGIAEQLIYKKRTSTGAETDTEAVYGLPTNADSLRLYYNPALFRNAAREFQDSLGSNPPAEELNPVKTLLAKAPATWSDLLAQVQYLTLPDDEEDSFARSAIALGTVDNVSSPLDILQLLMIQNGATIVSSNRKDALFNLPITTPSGAQERVGVRALELFASFSNPDSEYYTWNQRMPQDIDAFGQGKVAMVIAFSDFGAKLKQKYPRLSFETAAIPQISTNQDPRNIVRFSVEGVTRTAANREASFAMLDRYALSTSVVKSIARQAGVLSPFSSELEDNKKDWQYNQILTGTSLFKRFRTEYDGAFRQMILDVTQNGFSSEESAAKAVETVNEILQRSSTL
jgi:ABC-type glycerol-3-phosphate transport system substrate-binding protein